MFGAYQLIETNPSAAVVLIASGFESYFLDIMRIAWQESGLQVSAFDRMTDRNPPITSLVTWLPAAVGRSTLNEAPGDLHTRWSNAVNKRRNDVVHRANVHFTSTEAQDSLSVALETICYFDEAALARPHAYYTSR